MNVLGAGLHTPGGEGVRRQTDLEPVGERLRRGEVVATREKINLRVRRGVGHDGDFKKATRVQGEREKRTSGGEGGLSGGREEKANREGCEEEIR